MTLNERKPFMKPLRKNIPFELMGLGTNMDDALNAVKRAKNVNDLDHIANKAIAAEAHAKRVMASRELEADAREIRMRAERAIGTILLRGPIPGLSIPPTRRQIYRKAASIVEEIFEAYVKQARKNADLRKLSTRRFVAKATGGLIQAELRKVEIEPKDRRGDTIPACRMRDKLINVFGSFWDLESAVSKILAGTQAIGKIKESPVCSGIEWEAFDIHMKSMMATLTKGRPYAICPYCRGNSCAGCKERGWVTSEEYERAPKRN